MIDKVTRLTFAFFLVGLISFPAYARPQDPISQPASPQTTSPTTTAPQTTDQQQPAASPQTSDQQPSTTDTTDTKKTKPKKLPTNGNVDDIGSRDINKHDLDLFSIDKEIQMGRQLSAEVERQVKLQNDPIIGEYVNRVGQTIVRNSDCKVPFTIKVVESDEINAFALPGGFFYVNTGADSTLGWSAPPPFGSEGLPLIPLQNNKRQHRRDASGGLKRSHVCPPTPARRSERRQQA
jgi:hypothetical protein